MIKIPKINRFWLNKAGMLLAAAILTFNLPVQAISLIDQPEDSWDLIMISGGDSILSINMPLIFKTQKVVITAYSSTLDQTDSTPFITASNTRVRDGVVASNFLAFGTKIKIPALFGDKEFTVEDRMAKKHSDKIDIWFPERGQAKKFGIKEADVVILE
jgi:3D (Asp-Asp-Asp) domain-containing protein